MAPSFSDIGKYLFFMLVIQIPIFVFNIYGNLDRYKLSVLTYYSNPQYKPQHFYYIEEKHAPPNTSWLDKNPVYSKYKIETSSKRKIVNIIIIVSTAPRRLDRRMAIRETYWKECVKTKSITPECLFITDHLKPGQSYYNETQAEVKQYGDIRFQNLRGGVQFGERLMYHFLYALKNYEFDYFLRMDDDYFICMNNFLQELPVPKVKYLHWGWCHQYRGIMRPEESMILFSIDVIEAFLHQDQNKIKCHPLADQMVAQWTLEMKMKDIFRHDPRLHHTPIVSKRPDILQMQNVCSTFMGVHGSYPKEMKILYSHRGPFIDTNKTILDHSILMKSDTFGDFNWRGFGPKWTYEPRPCITNPTWDTPLMGVTNGAYGGRQETGD